MTNIEYFDYLKVVGKLPEIKNKDSYSVLCFKDVCIKDYVKVYEKMLKRDELLGNYYFDIMFKNLVYLLDVIHTQSDFDNFVKGLDKLLDTYRDYCLYDTFLESINKNYNTIVRQLVHDRKLNKKELKVEDLLKALKVIVNPYYVLYKDRLCNCEVIDVNPKSHFNINISFNETIENVAVMMYYNGECELLKINSYGGYKNSILKLRERLKDDSIDFAVCANETEHGMLVPLMNVLLTDYDRR